MTEVDIMADIECCVDHDCNHCSRGCGDGCYRKLFRDALNVIKLQKDALSSYLEKIESLKEESDRLRKLSTNTISAAKVATTINRVIEGYEDGETDAKIEALKYFIKANGLPCYIAMFPNSNTFRILLE